MPIHIETDAEGLVRMRPSPEPDWQIVLSGRWFEGLYHSGHVSYYVASVGLGEWVLDCVSRNTDLDDVTQEDVDDGRLNDDQLQALWGQTLEEAQSEVHRQIVAACTGADYSSVALEIGELLYRALCRNGGKKIVEPDNNELLNDPLVPARSKPRSKRVVLGGVEGVPKPVRRKRVQVPIKPTDAEKVPSDPNSDEDFFVEILERLAALDDPTSCLVRVTEAGRVPPEGVVTRTLMASWPRARSLSGGLFRIKGSTGLGDHGLCEERFLPLVLGRGDRKTRVLADLSTHEPEVSRAVFKKLKSVAEAARRTMLEIPKMNAAAQAKAMHAAVCQYGMSLLDDLPT